MQYGEHRKGWSKTRMVYNNINTQPLVWCPEAKYLDHGPRVSRIKQKLGHIVYASYAPACGLILKVSHFPTEQFMAVVMYYSLMFSMLLLKIVVNFTILL